MSNRSRSTLFLLEQLLVVLIFALCAAACVKIFVSAYTTAKEARELSQALLVAQSGAECYKAVDGDSRQLAELLGGTAAGGDGFDSVVVYYDQAWQICPAQQAAYLLRLLIDRPLAPDPLQNGQLFVETISGQELIAFDVAVGGGKG